MTAAFRRRPRHSNSLKDLQRLLGTASTIYENSKDRLASHAAKLNDTEANAINNFWKISTATLFLRRYGVQLIANDRVFHFYEDWPGMDLRLVSGSIWDGRSPLSTAPWKGEVRCAHKNWKVARRQLAAWRGDKWFGTPLFGHGGMGAAWLDDGPAGGVLRHLKSLALDRGAPAPLARQGGRGGRSFLIDEQTGYVTGLGGPTSQEKRLATISKQKLNDAIMALRDGDPAFLRECRAYERREVYLDELIGPRPTAHEAYVRHCLTSPRKKPIDIGSRGAAGDCRRLDPSLWPAFAGRGRGVRKWPGKEVLRAWLRSQPEDKTVTEIIPAREDELPKWYVIKSPLLFEHQKPEYDAGNIFDRTDADRDYRDAIFNPLGIGEEDTPKVRNGYAGRSLRRELKEQGIQGRVIDAPESWIQGRCFSQPAADPGWGHKPFDIKALASGKPRTPMSHDPWRHYYT